MAFQSHVFEDGRWVMRTTNINDVINNSNNKAAASPAPQRRQAPACAVMTRTIVHSPVAHWILSVRLRSSQHNDVAFIGDHYVQISELRRDGQLHSIARKCDFGSRIRNARVIGTSPVKLGFEQYATTTFHGRPDDDDLPTDLPDASPTSGSSTHGSSQHHHHHHHLPPQLLLIVLETGNCVFLFLRPDKEGQFEFEDLQHSLHSSRLVRPGFHLAVDPSSRYAAQACSRDKFVVHELESTDNLNLNLARGQPLRPIISTRPRHVAGVIHTIEFLYPRPQDPQHVILLLIVVNDGVTRMITYDWELGDDFGQVLAEVKAGHILPQQHEMPLMIIPLTIRSAFFAVSEDEIAYCADVLQGSPSFEPFQVGNFPPTENHEGSEPPLWTAWSRPPRLYPYNQTRDFIYMAREDGVVIFLECNTEDVLGASFFHGNFCNVSTAFASLADDTSSGEILVFGGDSGQGGVWSAVPREPVTKLCRIPNWSPTVDFVTTNEWSKWDGFDHTTGASICECHRQQDSLTKTNQICAAAGTGVNGSIVHYRHGLQASIGIEFDFGTVVRRCFMLSENELDPASGYHLFLSVGDKSILLYFDADFSTTSAREIDQGQTLYDLSSPTLTAQPMGQGGILQVTEKGIVLLFAPSTSPRHFSFVALGLGDAVVTDAVLQDDVLAITSHVDNAFQLHFFKLDTTDHPVEHMFAKAIHSGEVTALSLYKVQGKIYAVVCLNLGDSIAMNGYCVTDGTDNGDFPCGDVATPKGVYEPITSTVCIVTEDPQETILVAGTRDGRVITVNLSVSKPWFVERMGGTPAHVYSARTPGSVLICCGGAFYLASDYRENQGFHQKQNIWTVDANDSSKPSPAITSVTALPKSLSGNESNVPLLLLANDRFYLAELQPHAGPVQRHIPLGVTPQKILFSHVLKCLVVAVRTPDNKPALRFIDLASGADLSFPVSGQTKQPVEYVNGLGTVDDRIHCLEDWNMTTDDGHSYYYILVGTRGRDGASGRLLIISPQRERPQPGETKGKIKFWTRYKIKPPPDAPHGPVYAATAADDIVRVSIGPRIYEYRLDQGERKLSPVCFTDVGAPVWRLEIPSDMSRTLALVKGDSIRALVRAEGQQSGFILRHVEPASNRPGMDMLEVAGSWDPVTSRPIVSEFVGTANASIVLVSDQYCTLAGIWVPWDSPGRDCEVLFEAALPSSVRRLRLGSTLPAWSRERRKEIKYGLLPAAADKDAQILGMGIDGSMQHFTLLDVSIWRFLRFVQNIAETSAELYPFTHVDIEVFGDEFDPVPEMDRRLELQVDGDLMQRCLEKRALERLIGPRSQWVTLFQEYLDGLDGGRWTRGFRGAATTVGEVDYEDEEKDAALDSKYYALAYDILEYFLVPVI